MKKCMQPPLVTIITTVRNGARTIERTIQSVISQSYKHIQYVLIDAGSTDGTIDIIKKYEHRLDYWVSEADNGIYDGFNKGLLRAKGLYVGILNADDYLLPDAINQLVSNIPDYQDEGLLPILHANMKLVTPSDLEVLGCCNEARSIAKRFTSMPVNHPATYVPLSTYKRIGFYDKSYRIAGDYDFILRAAMLKVDFIHIDKIFVIMQTGGASSLCNAYILSFERFRARIKNGGGLLISIFRLTGDLTMFSARKIKRYFIPSKYELE